MNEDFLEHLKKENLHLQDKRLTVFWSKLIYIDLQLFILAQFVNYKSNEKSYTTIRTDKIGYVEEMKT